MHTIRILGTLAFGGYASIALAHLLVGPLRSAWGEDAAWRAVAGAPIVLVAAATAVVLLTVPARRS